MSDLSPLIQRHIRRDIQGMHAYAVQDSTGMIKLDAMENPHGLSPELQLALGQRLGRLAINRYPGARLDDLKGAIRQHAELPESYGLVLGNGSDELISLLAMVCDLPGACIVAPQPGFVMYAMSAQLAGLRFVGVDLTPDFELDVPAMLQAIAQHRPALVYLAYPNNPTANLWDEASVDTVVEAQGRQGGLVIMDEAYQPFSSRSYLSRMVRQPHVLLMRTLSKFGLAGVRIGYLTGARELTDEVDKARPPYNISVLNAECALFALEHAHVFADQAADIRMQRDGLLRELPALPGVHTWRSDANMILIRVPDAAKVFDGLRARGVLVKNVSKMHPMLVNCLRLTVGTRSENTRMLAALRDTL